MNRFFVIKLFIFVTIALIFGVIFYLVIIPRKTTIPLHAIQYKMTQTNSLNLSNMPLPSHNLQTIASNQWYSNIYTSFPTNPFFALPLAFSISDKGLGFSYPKINITDTTIFAPYTQDFTIGMDDLNSKPTILSIGDWNITTQLQTKKGYTMRFSLAHGIPYTTIHTTAPRLRLQMTHPFILFNHNQSASNSADFQTTDFLLSIQGNMYILAFPRNTNIQITTTSVAFSTHTVFIGLLGKREDYAVFNENKNAEILNTQATPVIRNNALDTTYSFQTNGLLPLIGMYPHQYDFLLDKPDILTSYSTLRGTINLVKTNSFTTELSMVIPKDTFTHTSNGESEIIKQLKKDIAKTIKDGPPASQDYTLGTWFGKVDSLLQLAAIYQLEDQKNALLSYVEPIFLHSLHFFAYDANQTSLLATKPEFGNEKLNDHHFHYGYYIRTAAILATFDPKTLSAYKPTISLMVNDIANTDRSSTTFPYVRTFDIYEGHSWADGYANFADGNDQESSSEAINAWYCVYLWSKVIHDTTLQTTELYLYNTEIESTYYYWFDLNKIYQRPYKHAIASIVWGGKVDFATWFSNDINMIYGIQLLPITPASEYLAKLPSFDDYRSDFTSNGGNIKKSWGDLYLIWEDSRSITALQVKTIGIPSRGITM